MDSSHLAAGITKCKKIDETMGMWVPNSERGHKMLLLEVENFFDLSNFYFVKLVSQLSNGAKIIKKIQFRDVGDFL